MTLASCTGPSAERIRSFDLGQVATDQAAEDLLRHMVSMMLRTSIPKLLLWEEELIAFHNDAYADLEPEFRSDTIGSRFPAHRADIWKAVQQYVFKALGGEEKIEADLAIFGPISGELRAPHYCRSYFTPVVDRTGVVRGVMIDFHDCTDDRQLSERLLLENRRMQDLFREAPVMLAYASSDDLRLHFVNEAFRNFYGRRVLEGRTVEEAIPDAEEQGFGALLREVVQTGETFIRNDVPVRIRDDGEEIIRYTDFAYHPVKKENSQIAGVLCLGTDVTEKVQARNDRNNLRHQILHASRVNAMGTVAMTLAHELNQPLAAATNYLNAAHRFVVEGGDSSAADALDVIDHARDQVIRAGDIIKRMRPLIRSGEAERQKVSVSIAVDRALELLIAADGFCIKVTKQIAPDAGDVLADPIQLEQVLINLLRNANEASQEASRKEVVIKTELTREGCVSVSLRDYGPGLATDKIEELHGLSSKIGKEGLGVGLALSQTLIEANGGKLQARDAPGDEEGAIFTFDLQIA
jgi:two-component system sensor kinase FixL